VSERQSASAVVSTRWRRATPIFYSLVGLSCGLPPQPVELPEGSFAFGVFGDGPYRGWEMGRFERVIEDVNRTDLQWLIHVGDILWIPCSDEAYQDRLQRINTVHHPVIYTPGDNEWTDCHEEIAGGYQPLDRLASIRKIFFEQPGLSLGAAAMPLETQSADSTFSEFPENHRWTFGGFVFATIHMVGSGNGLQSFPTRSSAEDLEVTRRVEAGIRWLEDAFARADSARGIVLAMHGDPAFGGSNGPTPGYETFMTRLTDLVARYPKPVLLIHGDSHEFRVDHPLTNADGAPYEDFTRLETFGSPDIGWVRVVVDTVAGRFAQFEPRLMRGWWW
jgi:hypothetical protein